ncbi:hypothetical protein SAMN05216337_106714 [Bradyrhizobium brasilense]|uniref:Uncharacterized protein n=1 Tax=Bradyrhizobium brasilense TaxID=1419277 RepID=A0A1G7N0F6_9BRAD|nr:hypothetical protein SAMN05216337_106714 [Bradyrhizobium brasilense]
MDFNQIDGGGSPGSPAAFTWTQEDQDLFSRIINEPGPSSSAVPEETAYDVSFAVPEKFAHGSQSAPGRMVERLGHLGLLPDTDDCGQGDSSRARHKIVAAKTDVTKPTISGESAVNGARNLGRTILTDRIHRLTPSKP